jgi:hypothetical protein
MRFKERDFKVLEALEKWGALGLGTIDGAFFRRTLDWPERMRLLFNEIDRRDYWHGAYKRLDMLRKQGLVKLESYINHHQTYLLTPEGHRLLKSEGRSTLMGIRPRLPEAFVDHELAVAAVGLVLEECTGKRVMSHRELYAAHDWRERRRTRREGRPLIPDLWIVDKERPCAVEVELCQKSERRYAGLWEDYRHRMPRGGVLLYLTGWTGLRDTMLRRANERQFPLLYAATLRDFRAARERCVFTSWRSVNQKADELQIVAGEAAAAAGRAA